MSRSWACAAVVLAACSDPSIPRADVAELCGQDGPVQVLALDRDEVVDERWSMRVGDRLFYTIRRFDHPISNVPVTHLTPTEREYAELSVRVESIGRCGEDRRVIGEGIDRVLPHRADGDAWLGFRSDTYEVFWIDVEGVRPPQRLLPIWNFEDVAAHGNQVFANSHAEQAALRFTLDGEQIGVETLTSAVVAELTHPSYDEWPDVSHDEMLVLDASGRLAALDFATARFQPLLDGVQYFHADEQHRWILWTELAMPDALSFERPVARLFDRETGTDLPIEHGSNAFGPLLYHDLLILTRKSALHDGLETELMPLPELTSVILDGQQNLQGGSPSNTFAFVDYDGGPTRVYQAIDGELQRIAEVDWGVLHDDQLWTGRCDDETCSLYKQSLPYGEARFVERVARGTVGQQIRVPGGRSIELERPIPDPEAWRPDPRATLWVRDDATGGRTLLDTEVSPDFAALEPHDNHPMLGWHTDEIVYQVRDLVGDRTGLWRARFE